MIGGKIKDWKATGTDVRFLVQGTGSEKNDTCCVTAKIPEIVQKELKQGVNIWWQSEKVMLTVYGYEDAMFEKVGFSGGDEDSFYSTT